ncbi:MAG: DUF1330 domain-containing protein [Candidatus Binatia bacterium]|nr:DUF1330 domain-containing protein [Candidatus Binatia bacterium]
MIVENRLYPDAGQIAHLQDEASPDGPIVMVNLLKFREKAQYPDGRDAHLSGREAYMRYGMEVAKLVEASGGRILFAGNVTFLTIGAAEELWDEVVLVEYPSRAAFLRMAMSPEWRAIEVHREAGLEGQLNIETVPLMREFGR